MIMEINEGDFEHIFRMVLNDNRGNVITEAMVLGLEATIIHYIKQLTANTKSVDDIPEID